MSATAMQRKPVMRLFLPAIGERLKAMRDLCLPAARDAASERDHQDKVAAVDSELRNLRARCLRSGYNAQQVESFAQCLLQAARRTKRKRWLRVGRAVALVVLLLGLLLQLGWTQRVAAAVGRAALLKLLLVWDWTQVYYSKCLVDNPLYQDSSVLLADDCQACEATQSIVHVHNLSATEVVDQFFRLDVPIIVEDGLSGWEEELLRSPRDIAQLYEDNEILRSERGCGFSTNFRHKDGGHRALLADILQYNLSYYYGHWENCHSASAKAFRAAYRRPYFLPPAVETAATSWVVITHNFHGHRFKQLPIDRPLLVLLQVSGEVDIQAEARTPCDRVCPVLVDTLSAGQAFVTTDFLWKTSYLPLPDQDSVTIGLGASY